MLCSSQIINKQNQIERPFAWMKKQTFFVFHIEWFLAMNWISINKKKDIDDVIITLVILSFNSFSCIFSVFEKWKKQSFCLNIGDYFLSVLLFHLCSFSFVAAYDFIYMKFFSVFYSFCFIIVSCFSHQFT